MAPITWVSVLAPLKEATVDQTARLRDAPLTRPPYACPRSPQAAVAHHARVGSPASRQVKNPAPSTGFG